MSLPSFIISSGISIIYLVYSIYTIQIDYNLGKLPTDADSLGLGYVQVFVDSIFIFIVTFSTIFLIKKLLTKYK